MSKKILLTAGILSAGLVFAGCSNTTTDTTANPAGIEETMIPEESMMVEDDAMMESGDEAMMESTEMTLDMFGFGYSQDTITAKPGETLTIELTNSQGFHDFVIDELDVASEQTNEGEVTSVTFTIPEDTAPGTEYEYYCSVGNHRAQGMVGTLIIE